MKHNSVSQRPQTQQRTLCTTTDCVIACVSSTRVWCNVGMSGWSMHAVCVWYACCVRVCTTVSVITDAAAHSSMCSAYALKPTAACSQSHLSTHAHRVRAAWMHDIAWTNNCSVEMTIFVSPTTLTQQRSTTRPLHR